MMKKLILSMILALSLVLTGCEDKEIKENEKIEVVDPAIKDEQTSNKEEKPLDKEEKPEVDKNQDKENNKKPIEPIVKEGVFTTVNGIDIPMFNGVDPYVVLNNNVPNFSEEELSRLGEEHYSSLDELGRVGVAFAVLGKETMPKEGEERGAIGMVKPSGWQTTKYDIVPGKYLYNRCHLIGWQLSNENANKENLMTGTRFLNIDGTLVFENMVADYIKETNNHVAYRITPIFEGDDLVAKGIQIEAYSVEDNGEGISINVFSYNAQPGININYATGESSEGELEVIDESTLSDFDKEIVYKTPSGKKYHNKEHAGENGIPVKRYQAKKDGLEPCTICFKDEK